MSTRVSIVIDSGGLLDRNAQQTAANRQALALADQRAAVEALAVERLTADRIAAGLDPLTGFTAPSSSTSFASTVNRFDQEPAANRRDGLEIMGAYIDFDDSIVSIKPPNSGIAKKYTVGESANIGNLGNLAAEAGLFLGNTSTPIVTQQWSQNCELLGGFKFELDPAFCAPGEGGCCQNPCWSEWLGGRTQTTRNEYGALTVNAISSFIRLVLPYNKNSFVVCFIYTYELYAHYTYGRNDVTLQSSLRLFEDFVDNICPGGTAGTLQELTTATTDTSTTVLTSRKQDPVFLSVLISRRDSREIPTPAAVQSILTDYSAASWSSQDTTQIVRTFAQGSGTTYVSGAVIENNMSPATVSQTFRNFSRDDTVYNPQGNFVRFPSEGSITATPVIYATFGDQNIREVDPALGSPSRIADFIDYYTFSPAIAADTRLIDKLPFLKVSSVSQDPGSTGSSAYEIEIKSQKSIIEGTDLGAKRKKLTFQNPVNVLTWNWNNAAFCKSSLLGLGFTEDALVP
jgi:hypothetical protein